MTGRNVDSRAIVKRGFGRLLVSLCVAVGLCAVPMAAQAFNVVFDEEDLGRFPSAWKAREQAGKEVYSVRKDTSGIFLHAESLADSYTIGHPLSVNLDEYPSLHFSWRALDLPPGGNEETKKTNDGALGVYVVFEGWSMPPLTIKYVWSTTLSKGSETVSPYSSRAKVIVLRSGEKRLGEWIDEKVDVLEDYRRLFGEEQAPRVRGIGVLTDSDNTGTRSAGDYRFFRFSKATKKVVFNLPLMSAANGVALALSGGAVRGVAHVAVLEVLEREGIPVEAIAGTSAGSIVGALYAAGVPLPEIRRLALETAWKKFLRPTVPKRGLFDSEGIRRFMDDNLPMKTFASLPVPFAAVATDLGTGEKVSLTTGSVARAVQASCSLPLVFTPTVIRGKTLVDGGVASMIPVRTAREELGAGRVVGVNVNDKAFGPDRFDTLFSIAVQITALWATRNTREEARYADVLVPVSAAGIALYDLTKTRELLRRGRQAAEKLLPAIRSLVGS